MCYDHRNNLNSSNGHMLVSSISVMYKQYSFLFPIVYAVLVFMLKHSFAVADLKEKLRNAYHFVKSLWASLRPPERCSCKREFVNTISFVIREKKIYRSRIRRNWKKFVREFVNSCIFVSCGSWIDKIPFLETWNSPFFSR